MTKTHQEYEIDEGRLTDFAAKLAGDRSPSGEEGGVAKLVIAKMERSRFRSKLTNLVTSPAW